MRTHNVNALFLLEPKHTYQPKSPKQSLVYNQDKIRDNKKETASYVCLSQNRHHSAAAVFISVARYTLFSNFTSDSALVLHQR